MSAKMAQPMFSANTLDMSRGNKSINILKQKVLERRLKRFSSASGGVYEITLPLIRGIISILAEF